MNKEGYEKLGTTLPDYEQVNDYFSIEELNEEKVTLKAICKKAKEHIEEYTHVIEGILQPENSITSFTEANAFSEEEKKKVLEVFRRLMHLERQLLAAEVAGEYEAAFLKNVVTSYGKIQKPLSNIFTQLAESWNHKEEEQTQEKYFG